MALSSAWLQLKKTTGALGPFTHSFEELDPVKNKKRQNKSQGS